MTSRDPGRIAQAFSGLSMRGHELAAEGTSGKTSRRSPSRVSGAMRQRLTGVRENTDQQGWSEAPTALGHLCFPPDQYPSGVGPGSCWTCRCGAVWVASGLAWDEYPTDPTRTAQPLKPERWHYVEGGQLNAMEYKKQEDLYDWRPLGPYFVKLARILLDSVQGRENRNWRDLP